MSEFSNLVRNVLGGLDHMRDEHLNEPEGVTKICDLSYKEGDEYNLLNLYFPQEFSGKLPVIINIHGGFYVYGNREVYHYYGMNLAKSSFIFVNANYHLAPEYKFPTQLQEINEIFNWIEKHADEYHMDLNNVFVIGDSAGAQMASQYMAILTDPSYAKVFENDIPISELPEKISVRAIALNCGLYSLKELEYKPKSGEDLMHPEAVKKDYLGEKFDINDERLNVLAHIREQYPATYIATAYYDFLNILAKPFYDLLVSKKIKAVYKVYGTEGQEYMLHDFQCNMNLKEAFECNNDEIDFFKKYIKI